MRKVMKVAIVKFKMRSLYKFKLGRINAKLKLGKIIHHQESYGDQKWVSIKKISLFPGKIKRKRQCHFPKLSAKKLFVDIFIIIMLNLSTISKTSTIKHNQYSSLKIWKMWKSKILLTLPKNLNTLNLSCPCLKSKLISQIS